MKAAASRLQEARQNQSFPWFNFVRESDMVVLHTEHLLDAPTGRGEGEVWRTDPRFLI